MGRAHAIRLAAEGADVVAVDSCADDPAIPYPLATPDDLAATVDAVRAEGRRAIGAVADVRDGGTLGAAVQNAVAELGRLDVVVANAGVCTVQRWDEVTPQVWDAVVGVNLTGVWNTCVAAAPHLVAAGGGSIVLVSSAAGLKGHPFFAPYVAAKHGVVGIMRVLAMELAAHRIRVNSVHPTGVDTPMLAGLGGLGERLAAAPELGSIFVNALPLDLVDAEDVAGAVAFLASDDARAITGLTMTVDAGTTAR
ncbi:MAG: mycofactocin-coupled SDR family oxidoreductase [Actinomycetota bacterium]|jgi:SDR family mycofactocin-dependent oxidoreductase|nr:mycofactocin-coupled SDR family oxidoreductase [Actinomycetota bacterium]